MGRKRRFTEGQVVTYADQPCVVVGYRQDRKGRGSYRLVRVLHLPAGRAFGPSVWVASEKIVDNPHPDRRSVTVRAVKANDRLGPDRGCTCQCCPHVSIPLSAILGGGEFKESYVQSVPDRQGSPDGGDPAPSGGTVP